MVIPRRVVLAVVSAACAALGGPLFSVSAAVGQAAPAGGSCPNEQLRTGYSAALPDCRAYELVTPPGTEPYTEETQPLENVHRGGEAGGSVYGEVASSTGGRLGFYSNYTPPGSTTPGPYYLATRGGNGWSTENLIPPQSREGGDLCLPYMAAYSPDLSRGILADGQEQQPHIEPPPVERYPSHNCGADEPSLVATEPRGFQNLFLRDNANGSYQLVDVTPAGAAANEARFQAASEDLSHVVFEEAAQLTADAPTFASPLEAFYDVYEWSGGAVHLVTILPDGTPVQGSLANHTKAFADAEGIHFKDPTFTHAVSADGSRVFFTAGGALYLREHPDQPESPLAAGHCTAPALACTVQVDASQAGGPGGGGNFMWASADGSVVYFGDDASAELTRDTLPGSGQNLYRYDVQTGALTDLTVGGAAGLLGVAGTSADGSYVYFTAEGALTGTPNSFGESATAGQPNLYLAHAGALTFIATLVANEEDLCDWTSQCMTARVSPNGLFAGFDSMRSLTGYDNVDAGTGGLDQEIFLYEAGPNKLVCVSCDPSGAAPAGPAGIREPVRPQVLFEVPGHLQRNVLDDGRVFFDTPDALLPEDGNGQSDVYEYQRDQLHLISSGSSGDPSFFYDASLSGDDAFFLTTQQLLPRDTDAAIGVYDARVNGGFPEAGLSAPPCSAEACRGAVASGSPFAVPASATFAGAGNPAALFAGKASGHAKQKQKLKRRRAKKRKASRKRATSGARSRRIAHAGRGGLR